MSSAGNALCGFWTRIVLALKISRPLASLSSGLCHRRERGLRSKSRSAQRRNEQRQPDDDQYHGPELPQIDVQQVLQQEPDAEED